MSETLYLYILKVPSFERERETIMLEMIELFLSRNTLVKMLSEWHKNNSLSVFFINFQNITVYYSDEFIHDNFQFAVIFVS